MATFEDIQKVISHVRSMGLNIVRTKEEPGTGKWTISCSDRDVDGSYKDKIKQFLISNKITKVIVNFVI